MGIQGTIHSIETFGTLDGPGIRYVLFLQGCSLRCRFCHNPDTWAQGGKPLTDSDSVVKDILSYRSFIRQGGVTLSGGEPLMQPEFALDIIKQCKKEGLHTALDTAGAIPLERSRAVLEAADLVLLDIKSLDDRQCFSLTGQGNANTLVTLDYCQSIAKPVWLRHVLVPSWTLDRKRLEKLATFLKKYTCIEKVELLPYHSMGQYKWEQLNLAYSLKDIPEPTEKELAMARKIFEDQGLEVLMTDLGKPKSKSKVS
ncbi:pyruvate formate-lyase-activating protein [uncultured Sphaerochaeta sp.]|uniref:pyruvate formate-lyase-activating protein n=1 Tax=uncultured Sphaerochaeta sp. TaxID=886478 RepID=UPI002A0A1D11|nr:pyruvate formate-lyase-activating protein [uncultured Sphaerochaeta sp.]